jgi:hypothetical protein
VDGGLKSAEDVPVRLLEKEVLDDSLQAEEERPVSWQAEQGLELGEQAHHLQPDVRHGVLNQAKPFLIETEKLCTYYTLTDYGTRLSLIFLKCHLHCKKKDNNFPTPAGMYSGQREFG